MTIKFMMFPNLLQATILRDVSDFDLMKFSMVSTKAKNLATHQNRSVAHIGCLVNFFYTDELAIFIDREPGLKSEAKDMSPVFVCRIPRRANEPTPKWEKETLMIDCAGRPTNAQRMAVFEKLVKIVRDVFITQEFYLNFSERFNLRESFFWNMRYPPNHLHFAQRSDQKMNFSVENVRFALENLTLDSLMINGDVALGYTCSSPLTSKMVNLGTSQWLELDAILNSTSEHLDFFDQDSLSNREIRQVIDKWLSGGLGNLKTMTLRTEAQTGNPAKWRRKLEKILSGIDFFRWSADNRPASCTSAVGELNLEGALDFMRDDGTVASLDLSPDYGIHFVVWPNPNDS